MKATLPIHKYKLVPSKPKQYKENEILIQTKGRKLHYAIHIADELIEKKQKDFKLLACGEAVAKLVKVVEYLKERVEDLQTMYEIQEIENIEEYQPLEEGLINVQIKKVVPFLTAFLTLDKNHGYEHYPGYNTNTQKVLPELKEQFTEDINQFLKKNNKKGYNNRKRGYRNNYNNRGHRNYHNNHGNYQQNDQYRGRGKKRGQYRGRGYRRGGGYGGQKKETEYKDPFEGFDQIIQQNSILLFIVLIIMSRNFCKKHLNRKLEFVCLDSSCKKSNLLCVLCVKKKHKECKSELMIKLNEDYTSQYKININFKPELFNIVKDQTSILFQSFLIEIQELQKDNNLKQEQLVVDKQQIAKDPQKDKYNYFYDVKNKKILIMPKDISIIQHMDAFEQIYKKNIQNFIKKILDDFKMIRFHQSNQLNLDYMKIHENLKLEKNSFGFNLSLPNSLNQYYLAIHNKPIKKNLNMEIQVDNLNPSDRYCEVGFLTTQQYDQYKLKLQGKYLLGKHCFCGYQKKGMDGLFQQLNLSNAEGLENKGIIKFKFNYLKGELCIKYDGKKKTDIFAKIDAKANDYYFYMCLYFKNQVAIVSYKQYNNNINYFFTFFSQQYKVYQNE